jgi:hypothetical protein
LEFGKKLENTKSSQNLELIKVYFGHFLLRPNHLGDIFQKTMRPTPKISPNRRNFAQSDHTA